MNYEATIKFSALFIHGCLVTNPERDKIQLYTANGSVHRKVASGILQT